MGREGKARVSARDFFGPCPLFVTYTILRSERYSHIIIYQIRSNLITSSMKS